MASTGKLTACTLVLLATVGLTKGLCTKEELDTLVDCFRYYIPGLVSALGKFWICDRSLINDNLCSYYASIVECTNNANVSRITCRPYGIDQIDALRVIPCKIYDFQVTCSAAPKIDTGPQLSARPPCALIALSASRHVTLLYPGCGQVFLWSGEGANLGAGAHVTNGLLRFCTYRSPMGKVCLDERSGWSALERHAGSEGKLQSVDTLTVL